MTRVDPIMGLTISLTRGLYVVFIRLCTSHTANPSMAITAAGQHDTWLYRSRMKLRCDYCTRQVN